jgi:uncharacterized protein (UPF0548 family)
MGMNLRMTTAEDTEKVQGVRPATVPRMDKVRKVSQRATMIQPRWSLAEPSDSDIAAFLARQETVSFSYAERGASQQQSPVGYDLDHNRVRLGAGEACFDEACAALRAWRMFPVPWTRIVPSDGPLREEQTLAMIAHAFGWWINGCRIVYLVDETTGAARRFGFAYGTLQSHVEQGEERFLIEMSGDGTVWYDLRAFSRPRHVLVRLAKPLARRLQRRFVRDSQAAMQRAVAQKRSHA